MLFRIVATSFALATAMLMSGAASAQPYYGQHYRGGSYGGGYGYYGPPPRNRPYYEERRSSYGPHGRSIRKRFVEDDPRGGKIIREEWRNPRGGRVTRRTFIDSYGNRRVVVDRY